jgi:RNA-directed DNA polymerase
MTVAGGPKSRRLQKDLATLQALSGAPSMIRILQRAIEDEARRRLDARQSAMELGRRHVRRINVRTAGHEVSAEPAWIKARWAVHPHFDPAYCLRHSKFLASGIWRALSTDGYECRPSIALRMAKPAGGHRTVHVLAIPDAAVARIFTTRLIDRNSELFSSSSYAYQRHRSSTLAVLKIQHMLAREHVFAIEYDFKDYFDSIRHDYIHEKLEKPNFVLTTFIERRVIGAFLRHQSASRKEYSAGKFDTRHQGTPQGSSISLFVANLGLHELDLELEAHPCQFSRYADDLVVVAYSYDDALGAADVIARHCDRAGTIINRDKSSAVKLLSRSSGPDSHLDFLGHRFRLGSTSVSPKSVKRIKARLAKILVVHLLQYLSAGFNPARVGPGFVDWDLVTAVNELRRYIYGGVGEAGIRDHLSGRAHLTRMKGPLAFFCLIDDKAQLKRLDGWLVSVVRRALRARQKLLFSKYGVTTPLITESNLRAGTWHSFPKLHQETRLPSFYLAWRAARKCWQRFGTRGLEVPTDVYEYDWT